MNVRSRNTRVDVTATRLPYTTNEIKVAKMAAPNTQTITYAPQCVAVTVNCSASDTTAIMVEDGRRKGKEEGM